MTPPNSLLRSQYQRHWRRKLYSSQEEAECGWLKDSAWIPPGLFIYEFKLDRVSQFVAPFVTLFYQLNKRDRQGQGLEGSWTNFQNPTIKQGLLIAMMGAWNRRIDSFWILESEPVRQHFSFVLLLFVFCCYSVGLQNLGNCKGSSRRWMDGQG